MVNAQLVFAHAHHLSIFSTIPPHATSPSSYTHVPRLPARAVLNFVNFVPDFAFKLANGAVKRMRR